MRRIDEAPPWLCVRLAWPLAGLRHQTMPSHRFGTAHQDGCVPVTHYTLAALPVLALLLPFLMLVLEVFLFWSTGMCFQDVCVCVFDISCVFEDMCFTMCVMECHSTPLWCRVVWSRHRTLISGLLTTKDFDIWSLVTRHTCIAAFATILPTTVRLSHPASRHSTRALNQSGVPLNECVLMCNQQHVASFFAPRLSFTSLYLPPSLA